MLMVGARVQAPSIGRLESCGAVCVPARSAAAYVACLGRGSARKTLVASASNHSSAAVRSRLELAVGGGAGGCCTEMLPGTYVEADRAFGPILPPSARERWSFFVLRDSCHAALQDEPSLP